MEKKAYNTCCSQTVTHPSTEPARHCLTSVIRREQVYSMWYGSYLVEKCQLHKLAVTVTAVKVGVPMQAWKLVGKVHMCPSQCQACIHPQCTRSGQAVAPVYKEWPSLYTCCVQIGHWLGHMCTFATSFQAWALHFYSSVCCNISTSNLQSSSAFLMKIVIQQLKQCNN